MDSDDSSGSMDEIKKRITLDETSGCTNEHGPNGYHIHVVYTD